MGTYSAIFSWDSLRSLSVVTCHTNDMSFVPASGGLFVLGGWTDLCLHLALKTRLILHQYGDPKVCSKQLFHLELRSDLEGEELSWDPNMSLQSK